MAAKWNLHTGSQIVFLDRWGDAQQGVIESFERSNGKVTAVHVRGSDHGGWLIGWVPSACICPADSDQAKELLTPVEHLLTGTLVRVTIPGGKMLGGMHSGDLGVVTADKGRRVNVSKLGGWKDSQGRQGYARMTHKNLTVVDLASLRATAAV